VQFAQQGVALEAHARLQRRRKGQAALCVHCRLGLGRWQGVHARQLHGDVVLAAARQGRGGQGCGGRVQVGRVPGQGGVHIGRAEVFVGAVGGQQVDLALGQRPAAVVDLDRGIGAQRAGQVDSAEDRRTR
jgi:hypothetical protein